MNAATAKLPRRRDEARALFRNAILDAAEGVFAERGFHGARIQDIAARARIAVGTVYNHFAHKDEVLAALLEERSQALLARLRTRRDDPKGFRQRLSARIARMLDYVDEHRAFFAIASEQGLFAGTAAPGAHSGGKRLRTVEQFRAFFRALVKEGLDSGELESLDADVLARFLGGAIRACVLTSLAGSRGDSHLGAAATVDLFLYGAARRRPRRGGPASPGPSGPLATSRGRSI